MKNERSTAILAGHKKYLTGKPCKNGHVAPRYTESGACSACINAPTHRLFGNDWVVSTGQPWDKSEEMRALKWRVWSAVKSGARWHYRVAVPAGTDVVAVSKLLNWG